MTVYSKTFTDDLGVADRHTWSEMIYSWDTYTGSWDSYGDIPIQRIFTAGRTFTETLTQTEIFSTIATIHRSFTDSISYAENFVKKPIKMLSEALSHTEAFNRVSTSNRTLTEEITHTDSVMHRVSKNLVENLTITGSLIKKSVKRFGEALGMTDIFSRVQMSVRTLTDAISIAETNITWDMMTASWDDYNENWDYYSKAFVVIKIYRRIITDSMTFLDSIITRILQYIKFTYLKTREVTFWGKAARIGFVGKVGSEKLFGKVSNDNLNGKLKNEKLFGKIIKG